MTTISLEEIRRLREETGVGIMVCREALVAAAGDFDQAKIRLENQAAMKVESRSDRATVEGVVVAYVHPGGRVGALVEVDSETDFVSRSSEFQKLAFELAMQVAAMSPTSVEELLAQDWIRDPSKKVADLLTEYQAKTQENLVLRRFERFEVGKS